MTSATHLEFTSKVGRHVLVTAYSRLFDLAADAPALDDAEGERLIAVLGQQGEGEDSLDLIPEPSPQSISLNVSSSCNLACTYCYAGQGAFAGRQGSAMGRTTALSAIDQLVAGADPSRPITVGFLGGEPFMNRDLVHDAVAHSVRLANARQLDIRFSVTTNATLLKIRDIELLRSHPFAVTVSLDGGEEVHDAARATRNGRGSWRAACAGIEPLLREPGLARLAARATVRRTALDLVGTFDAIAACGFEDIGLSPLRAAPDSPDGLRDEDWPVYLGALTRLADREVDGVRSGQPIRLTNLAVALKQIHRGAASPYPCGAGGGYFSVAADGDWYACHRAIGKEDYRLGDGGGLRLDVRRRFLKERHVDADTDCRACWARYLCSGGCHQEKSARTRASCDFVRGWLRYCLTAYCELRALEAHAGGRHA